MATQSQVVYTVGILISAILILLFFRALFLRRARALTIAESADPNRRVNVVVVGGGWRDGGIGGLGGRQYRVPTDVPRAPPAARMRGGEGGRAAAGEDAVVMEDLPRYEAPPPEYESVVKERREEEEGRSAAGTSAAERADTVIEMGNVGGNAGAGTGSSDMGNAGTAGSGVPAAPAAPSAPSAPSPSPEDGGGIGSRLFGRFGRR